MTIIGYYLNCDDAACVDCFEAHGGEDQWREDGGFESWDDPLAISSMDESDTPTHCVSCGIILEHDLTSEGLDYVAEAIREGFQEGKQNPVTVQWINTYGDQLDDGADMIDCYKLLPIDRAWIDTDREDLKQHARLAGWEIEGEQ